MVSLPTLHSPLLYLPLVLLAVASTVAASPLAQPQATAPTPTNGSYQNAPPGTWLSDGDDESQTCDVSNCAIKDDFLWWYITMNLDGCDVTHALALNTALTQQVLLPTAWHSTPINGNNYSLSVSFNVGAQLAATKINKALQNAVGFQVAGNNWCHQ